MTMMMVTQKCTGRRKTWRRPGRSRSCWRCLDCADTDHQHAQLAATSTWVVLRRRGQCGTVERGSPGLQTPVWSGVRRLLRPTAGAGDRAAVAADRPGTATDEEESGARISDDDMADRWQHSPDDHRPSSSAVNNECNWIDCQASRKAKTIRGSRRGILRYL